MAEERRRQYARDFSELSDADRLALANAMVRIGIEAAEKARKEAMRAGRAALSSIKESGVE